MQAMRVLLPTTSCNMTVMQADDLPHTFAMYVPAATALAPHQIVEVAAHHVLIANGAWLLLRSRSRHIRQDSVLWLL